MIPGTNFGHNDDDEVGRFTDGYEVRITRKAFYRIGLAVDRKDLPLVAARNHIGQDLVAHLALLAGGPDDSNRFRVEETLKTHAAVHPFYRNAHSKKPIILLKAPPHGNPFLRQVQTPAGQISPEPPA